MRKFVVLGLVFLLSATSVQTKESRPFDELVSRDTILYISVKNVSDLGKKLDSAFEDLLNEKEVKNYLSGLDFSKGIKEFEESTGLSLKSLCAGFQGEVAFYFDMPVLLDLMAGNLPNMGLLIDARGNKDEFAKIIKSITGKLEDNPAFTKSEDKHLDESYQSYKFDKGNLVFVTLDSIFCITTSIDGTKRIIENYKDKRSKKSLASNENYTTIVKRFGGSDVLLYLDTTWIKDLILFIPEANIKGAVEIALKTLGIYDLKGVGLSLSVAKNQVKSEAFIYCPKMPGLFKFAGGNKKRTPPAWVPADATGLWVGELNWKALWDSIDDTVTKASEKMGQPFKIRPMVKALAGIDIKEEIFDTLDSEYVSYQVLKKPYTVDGYGSVVAFKLKDAKTLASALESLASRLPLLTEEKIEGNKFYHINVPGEDEKFTFGVAEGSLVVGNKEQVMQTVKLMKSTSDPSTLENPVYKALSKVVGIPADNNGFGYQHPSSISALCTIIPQFVEKIKENPVVSDEIVDGIANAFNIKNLPKPETVEKHIMGCAGYTHVEDNGLYFKWVMVTNKK